MPLETKEQKILPPAENAVLTFFSSIPYKQRVEKWKGWEATCRQMSEFTRGCLQEMIGPDVIREADRVATTAEHSEMAAFFLRTGIKKFM